MERYCVNVRVPNLMAISCSTNVISNPRSAMTSGMANTTVAPQQSNWMAALPEPTLTQIGGLVQKTFLEYM